MSTCSVYHGTILLGSGSISAAATSITSYDRVNETGSVERVTGTGRNVDVAITSSTHIGSVFRTRVLVDGASTLTIADKNPFAT